MSNFVVFYNYMEKCPYYLIYEKVETVLLFCIVQTNHSFPQAARTRTRACARTGTLAVSQSLVNCLPRLLFGYKVNIHNVQKLESNVRTRQICRLHRQRTGF